MTNANEQIGRRVRSMTRNGKYQATEMHLMTSNRKITLHSNPLATLALLLTAAGLAALLTGCGGVRSANSVSGGVTAVPFEITGNVHGGQQPVNLSTMQLYTVGTSGLQSAATPMLTSTVQTNNRGFFRITGLYDCTTVPATQVYLTATGGDPGGGTNAALTLAAMLGPCTSLTSSTFIQMNEVTTVAAAYALAPFAKDITHIGALGSNPVGLLNAFTNAATLANVATGYPGGAGLTNVTVPITELNTLGNIIATCVNSTGPASANCSTLFAATGASETFGAALAMAKNPGASAITALYTLPTPSAPFQPSLNLTTQPNDFTISVTSTANGTLATPYGIAIDAAGNAWVTNETGNSITELAPNGNFVASATAASANLYGAQGVAIDTLGDVWVANTAGNSVLEFTVAGGAVTGFSNFTAGGITAPAAIALDSQNKVWVANFNGNSVTGLTQAGAALSGSPFTGSGGNISVPQGIAIGPTGSVYVTSGTGSIVTLNNTGAYVAALNDGTLQGPAGVAVDASGRVSATGFTTGNAVGGAVSEFAAGTAVSGSPATTGVTSPAGVASDGSSVWVANNTASGGLAQYTNSAALASPVAGFGSLNAPVGVAVDNSGSVWTTNSGSNSVTKFIGLAAPVVTPLVKNVGP